MKKSKKRKNNQTTNKPKNQRPKKKGPPPQINKPEDQHSKKASFFKRALQQWNILGKKIKPLRKKLKSAVFIGLIISTIPTTYFIYDRYFKSQYEKFEEESIKQGTVKFSPIKDSDTLKSPENKTVINPSFYIDSAAYHYPFIKGIYVKNLEKKLEGHDIYFNMGANVMGLSKTQLYEGANLMNYVRFCYTEPLLIFAKGDRIYVSAKFIDLRTENEIGEMNFNHWKIYNGEFLDYHEADNKFEVIDKQGNIVFSIANIGTSDTLQIAISGYFNAPDGVLILNTQRNRETERNICIKKKDSNWLKQATIEVKKIKSVFPLLK